MNDPGQDRGDVRSRSHLVRVLFNLAGAIALGLGILGVFLPLLPTTPFVLLAAACFARGSERFHQWLLASRTFGSMVREWAGHRSLPYRTKITAIVLMSLTMAVSITFFVRPVWLKVLLALFGCGLAAWMYRIPSRDRPANRL
ncbi:MAG TPA: YbaN family protein [Burkholderiaceae bacterium]|nr:YbaN family protein [Burkholderiaceae bacterium]